LRKGESLLARPWRNAFFADRRLPASDEGPVLFFAFFRFAAIC
jgi:hypothetical protein